MIKNIKWQRWKNPLNKDKDRSFVRMTPFGPDAVRLTSSDKNSLRWWVGHTNFDIDEVVYEIIKNTKGVEIIKLFSPYRFRICPGLNFNADIVLRDIEKRTCGDGIPKITDKYAIDIAKKRLDFIASTDNWLIYVLPNGRFESFSSSNSEEYLQMLSKYDQTEKEIGGFVMTS